MYWIIYVLSVLLLIRMANHYRVKLATLKTQNKLTSLKHELTLSYIDGKMKCDKDGAIRLNNLIVVTEGMIPKMNIWTLIYTAVFKKNIDTRSFFDAKSHEHCPEFSRIYGKYTAISTKFLLNKSIFSLVTMSLGLYFAKHISRKCVEWIVQLNARVRNNFISQYDKYRPTF